MLTMTLEVGKYDSFQWAFCLLSISYLQGFSVIELKGSWKNNNKITEPPFSLLSVSLGHSA